MASIQSYRDLEVWKRAMDLAVAVYGATRAFPADERFGLTAQVRRSCTSIAANIAEGYGRQSKPTYIHFLKIAQGSLKETETHLILAHRLDLLKADDLAGLLSASEQLGRMLRALILKLADHSSS